MVTGPIEALTVGRSGEAIEVIAPAKVNLFLHVVGRRLDGYHELDSLVVFAAVGDRIAVEADAALRLTIDGPFAASIPATDDNLVLRAARRLSVLDPRNHTLTKRGAAITLTKSLPVAAGIGGGSADAAATLRALCALWRFDPKPSDLDDLALELGADVPMCLAGRPAFVGGIGERLDPPPPLPPAWLVLANPGVALPTPTVFRQRSGSFSPPGRFDAVPADATALADVLAARRNDLTEAAVEVEPVVGTCLEALARLPDCLLARMSGSGATCFGLFVAEPAARSAAADLASANPAWWVRAAPILDSAG